jgi:hypothetical protein
MWPKDKLMFGAGVLGLLNGILSLRHIHSRYYESTFDRYFGLVWFLNAAVFLYRAYRPSPRSATDLPTSPSAGRRPLLGREGEDEG